MFKGKRFKQERSKNNNNNLQQKQQIITASSHLQIINKQRYSLRHRSKSVRGKLSSQKVNTKRRSLDHRINPQQKNNIRLKEKGKSKRILEDIQSKDNKPKIPYLNKCFNLKIKQSKQKEQVTPLMRIIVIDWLMQLRHQLSLSKQALHHSIYYLDQLFSKIAITKNQLQIYALCCFMIAQKLQSQRFITPSNASELLKNQISEQDFISLQQQIIKILDFKLHPFTFWDEVNILLKAFESYFKHQLKQSWKQHKHRALWIAEGIVMQNSYFKTKIIQSQVCFLLLYSIVQQYDPNLIKYFWLFCNNLKGTSKFKLQYTQGESKFLNNWLFASCGCLQMYDDQCYHSELKMLAASCLYN